ncbi:MAG: LacI family DNA-binding transcriptional regulator [Pseudomonadota bacterium]
MTDVSRIAGVSTATVSRVLNNPDIVDEKTRRDVRKVINLLGYRPNVVARGLASRSSRTIGVVVNRFSTDYYGQMVDGVEQAMRERNFNTIAESSRQSKSGEMAALMSLIDRQCDAVVLHSDATPDDELAALMKAHPQIIVMNRQLKGYEHRCVYLDSVHGGALAAKALHDAGHRHFASVLGPPCFHQSTDRLAGFSNELKNLGHEPGCHHLLYGDFGPESGYRAMKQIIEQLPHVTGVFFHNDEMALGALDACYDSGKQVPHDYSIIGFDDLKVARHCHPKLTTVRQPLNEIGIAAGRLAHAMVCNKNTEDAQRVFRPELILRGSVCAAPHCSVSMA